MSLFKRKKFSKFDAKKLDMFHSFLLLLALLAVLALLAMLFVGVSRVSGYSMSPTYSDGQAVLFYRLQKSYAYDDVVAIKMPSGERYIKRVVGLPGDVIDIRDGVLYVNDKPEPQGDWHGITEPEAASVHYPYTVEENRYFTLGDNREVSVDSRTYGSVSIKQIQGRVLF